MITLPQLTNVCGTVFVYVGEGSISSVVPPHQGMLCIIPIEPGSNIKVQNAKRVVISYPAADILSKMLTRI